MPDTSGAENPGHGGTADQRWYWCLRHERTERAGDCRAEDRLGPYATEADARAWRERVERRNDRWEDDDDRWHGRER